MIGVEQQVLVPGVRSALDHDGAHLEADHLVLRAVQLAARAERNERLDARLLLELLQDLQTEGVVASRMEQALQADGGERVREAAQLDVAAAVRAVQ